MRPPCRPALILLATLVMVGCATTSSTSTESTPMPSGSRDLPLVGIDWRLVSAPGGGTTSGAGAVTLRFEEGSFSMKGPCNTHTGRLARVADTLAFGGDAGVIVSTKMLCPPEIMAREKTLLTAIQGATAIEFEGPFLQLITQDGTWRFDSRDLPPAEGRERIVQVAGQRVPCTGVAPMLCLQVRSQPGAAWEAHYGEIEGFDWQVGVEYVIRVRELAVANPPADGSSLRWVLEEILERSP